MGRTQAQSGTPSPFRVVSRNGERCDAADGAIGPGGTTVGTMLHGIFENHRVRTAMLDSLRARKGLAATDGRSVASREAEYDRLADAVRTSLDLAAIRRIAGIA